MKYLIIASALFVAALAQQAEVHDVHGEAEVHKKCQNQPETHVDDAVFEKLKNKEKVDFPENFGKHMICMVKGLNMLKEDGKVNVEGVKTHIQHVITDEHAVESILKKCAVDEDTPEKTALRIQKCLYKHKVFGGDHDHNHNHSHSSESSESESDEHHHGHGHGHH